MPNTRTLYLLRHAKSIRDVPSPPDHERPLAPRGERAAELIARHLQDEGIHPDLVLCSSARRTRETLDRIASALGEAPAIEIDRALYDLSADALLERIRLVSDEVGSLMVIGHNPGLQDLALKLVGGGDLLTALREKFPTGALATLGFEGRWADLPEGRARLTALVVPRQLG